MRRLGRTRPSQGLHAAAVRALLHTTSVDQVTPVLATFIRDLGGGLVPARLADPANTIPIDVSLGFSEPLLPYADSVSVAAMRLAQLLPEMVEDARLVLMRLQGDVQRNVEATRDPLTGLLTRRAWMRRLAEADVGDSVCLIDLDRFKAVNDREGHKAGDAVLRAVGALLLKGFREADCCGRYGGDELTCLTPRLPAEALAQRCEALRAQWELERPACATAVGFSIGGAAVTAEGAGLRCSRRTKPCTARRAPDGAAPWLLMWRRRSVHDRRPRTAGGVLLLGARRGRTRSERFRTADVRRGHARPVDHR